MSCLTALFGPTVNLSLLLFSEIRVHTSSQTSESSVNSYVAVIIVSMQVWSDCAADRTTDRQTVMCTTTTERRVARNAMTIVPILMVMMMMPRLETRLHAVAYLIWACTNF